MTESQDQPPARPSPYKPLRGIFVIILAVTAVVAISKMNQANEIVPWRSDFNKAREEARSSNKPVFAYFTAEWCGPCQAMKRTTWADANVESALRSYVPVRIDADKEPELTVKYQVDGFPAFFVLDADGRVLREFREGALEPEEFLRWLGR